MADDEVMAEVQVTEPETATRGAAPGGTVPWVEKYRPATIDDLQQQDQVKSHAAPLPDPRRSSAHNAPLAISHVVGQEQHVRGAHASFCSMMCTRILTILYVGTGRVDAQECYQDRQREYMNT